MWHHFSNFLVAPLNHEGPHLVHGNSNASRLHTSEVLLQQDSGFLAETRSTSTLVDQ